MTIRRYADRHELMLNTLKLLLPALMPSWRFFSEIAPSPRIEVALLDKAENEDAAWQEFRPRPQHVSLSQMFLRMFYNAHWNENLFLMSCAERYTKNSTDHSLDEIVLRIKTEFERESGDDHKHPFMKFRLVFVHRDDGKLQKHVTFVSTAYSLVAGDE